jgi:hypothetical protein
VKYKNKPTTTKHRPLLQAHHMCVCGDSLPMVSPRMWCKYDDVVFMGQKEESHKDVKK